MDKLEEYSDSDSDFDKEELKTIIKQAINQDAVAQYELAILFYKITEDNHAFYWMEKSFKQHYPPAINSIAYYYRVGIGTKKNISKAINIMKIAAKTKYPPSQLNLGLSYLDGKDLKQNKKKGFEWILKAANQNFQPAQFELSLLYLNGIGTPINKNKSFNLMLDLAKDNYNCSQYKLGYYYFYGIGTDINYDLSINWLLKSLSINNDNDSYLFIMENFINDSNLKNNPPLYNELD